MDNTLLGGLAPAQFMRRHWQKTARLIRQALPGFAGILTKRELFALAGRDDVESRLVVKGGSARKPAWSLAHGPFRAADFKSLPATGWTLLVQGVDLHLDAAAALLRRFAFIPYARLDDLMISYAAPGGGVGPHFDSYDVFLLQGPGQRRWQVSTQQDLRLSPGLPLKILRHFKPAESWSLDPGDMLYLPPSVAHDGVAITECMTYSIGFRAPTTRELVESFLQFLPDMLPVAEQRYADPERAATHTPGRIDATMQRRLGAMLRSIRWDRAVIERFLGCILSEPKAEVFFDPPENPLSLPEFVRNAGRAADRAVRLDRRARMLYDSASVYLNGELIAARADHAVLATLADRRRLPAIAGLPKATLRLLHEAYLTGALHVGSSCES
jgi:50S ribosomal protein L16 3-hydroxylase